jgi:hypothetical protein
MFKEILLALAVFAFIATTSAVQVELTGGDELTFLASSSGHLVEVKGNTAIITVDDKQAAVNVIGALTLIPAKYSNYEIHLGNQTIKLAASQLGQLLSSGLPNTKLIEGIVNE